MESGDSALEANVSKVRSTDGSKEPKAPSSHLESALHKRALFIVKTERVQMTKCKTFWWASVLGAVNMHVAAQPPFDHYISGLISTTQKPYLEKEMKKKNPLER